MDTLKEKLKNKKIKVVIALILVTVTTLLIVCAYILFTVLPKYMLCSNVETQYLRFSENIKTNEVDTKLNEFLKNEVPIEKMPCRLISKEQTKNEFLTFYYDGKVKCNNGMNYTFKFKSEEKSELDEVTLSFYSYFSKGCDGEHIDRSDEYTQEDFNYVFIESRN